MTWTPEQAEKLRANVANAVEQCVAAAGLKYPINMMLQAHSGALLVMRAVVVDGTLHLITMLDFKPGVDFCYPADLMGLDPAGQGIRLFAYDDEGPVAKLKEQLGLG